VLACANLANLLLVRAGARERELAVRAALGAGSDRLMRQMITESLTLAVLGGTAGVLLAALALPLLSLMIPPTLAIASEPRLDLRMLAIAGLFTALTGLGFGLAPALRASGRSGLRALREGARAGSRRGGYRSALVAIEVAASVLLLTSSGLLIRAVLRVEAVDSGFQAEGVLALRTVLTRPEQTNGVRRDEFYNAVLTRVRALPGVQSAAYTSGLPMVMTGGIAGVVVPGQEVRPDGDYTVSRRYITPQFFATLGIPLRMGRDFEDADSGERRAVAIVSESFARRYWPNEVALSRVFQYQSQLFTVVGVAGDIRVRGLERTSEPQMYLPASRAPEGLVSI
jgi:predicted permease